MDRDQAYRLALMVEARAQFDANTWVARLPRRLSLLARGRDGCSVRQLRAHMPTVVEEATHPGPSVARSAPKTTRFGHVETTDLVVMFGQVVEPAGGDAAEGGVDAVVILGCSQPGRALARRA